MAGRRRLPCGLTGAATQPVRAARAVPPATATVPVTLGWRLLDGILALTATTAGTGAGYQDTWSVSPSLALTSMTVVETSTPPGRRYVSRAAVAPSSLADDTTYTFSYAILVRAETRTWVGSASLVVTVGSGGSL